MCYDDSAGFKLLPQNVQVEMYDRLIYWWIEIDHETIQTKADK